MPLEVSKSLSIIAVITAIVIGACGKTVYVNPQDRRQEFDYEETFFSPKDASTTYNLVLEKLMECLGSGSYNYRIRGDGKKEIIVDSGIGFERSFYLADAIILRVLIGPALDSQSEVRVFQRYPYSQTFVNATRLWVESGYQPCRA